MSHIILVFSRLVLNKLMPDGLFDGFYVRLLALSSIAIVPGNWSCLRNIAIKVILNLKSIGNHHC